LGFFWGTGQRERRQRVVFAAALPARTHGCERHHASELAAAEDAHDCGARQAGFAVCGWEGGVMREGGGGRRGFESAAGRGRSAVDGPC